MTKSWPTGYPKSPSSPAYERIVGKTSSPVSTTAQCGAGEALKLACMRLQGFLDTFGDLGDCVTQADINDWIEAADLPAPVRAAQEDELRVAFQNVDDLDWRHLLSFIPDSGHGRFWKAVFEEVRIALAVPQDNPQQKEQG